MAEKQMARVGPSMVKAEEPIWQLAEETLETVAYPFCPQLVPHWFLMIQVVGVYPTSRTAWSIEEDDGQVRTPLT
jgi:hypothetical protein